MRKQRQSGFVRPLKIVQDQQLWTGLSSALQHFGHALEDVAPLLLVRHSYRLGNILKNPPQTWHQLSQFWRFLNLPAEIIAARRSNQHLLEYLNEGQIGQRFVAFVAPAEEASETSACGVFRHFDRQARLSHSGATAEHHQGPATPTSMINSGFNDLGFLFPADERSCFGC